MLVCADVSVPESVVGAVSSRSRRWVPRKKRKGFLTSEGSGIVRYTRGTLLVLSKTAQASFRMILRETVTNR